MLCIDSNLFQLVSKGDEANVRKFRAVSRRFREVTTSFLHTCLILPVLLPEIQFDALICLQIDAALPITDSDPSLESAAFFQQVTDFLKSVKVEELQLFSFGLELDAIANSGSKLRVLQYRYLNLFWDTTRHYRRDYKKHVLRLSSTLKASQPSPSPVLP